MFVRYHMLQKSWKQKSLESASLVVDLLTWKDEPLMIWAPLLKVDLPRVLSRKESLLSLSDCHRILRVLNTLQSTIHHAEKREERWKDVSQRTAHVPHTLHSSSSSSRRIKTIHDNEQGWKRQVYGIYMSDDVAMELKERVGELLAGVLRTLTTVLGVGGSGKAPVTPLLDDSLRMKSRTPLPRSSRIPPGSSSFSL